MKGVECGRSHSLSALSFEEGIALGQYVGDVIPWMSVQTLSETTLIQVMTDESE